MSGAHTPMHDALFHHMNSIALSRFSSGSLALPGAEFFVSRMMFHEICTERPEVWVARKVFGLPVHVDNSMQYLDFKLEVNP